MDNAASEFRNTGKNVHTLMKHRAQKGGGFPKYLTFLSTEKFSSLQHITCRMATANAICDNRQG